MEPEPEMIDVGTLIPHQGPMLLVNSLLHIDLLQKKGSVLSILQKDKPYWNAEQHFRHHWLLEIMAQSAAAVLGSLASDEHDPHQPGFLLAIRQWTLLQKPSLVPLDPIRVEVLIETEWAAMSQVSMQAFFHHEKIAEAQMSFFQESKGLS
jgi:predicted hotdog family 3-hydroxylacyl-ACP dehydratase